jgi:uncharacterized repeat protein (TIGR02543 family)
LGATSTPYSIQYANNGFVVVGDKGLILQSNSFSLYSVTYNGNGSTGGSLPSVSKPYLDGDSVSVLGNTGSLVNGDNMFAGWNTKADGTGKDYAAWDTFNIDAENVTLYAKWRSSYIVTYNGNNSTGGSVPVDSGLYAQGAPATVKGNTGNLVRTGYAFAGWNTKANGTGTDYAADAAFNIGTADVVLYAKWNSTYKVTYNGSNNTGGAVPVDSSAYSPGASVTVKGNTGNLVRTSFAFVGWNTKADGTGTDYAADAAFNIGAANVVLYAKWNVIKGDIDGDGQVTPADALYVTKYVQGKIQLTQTQMDILDMDNDGLITANDAKLILQIYLGGGQV